MRVEEMVEGDYCTVTPVDDIMFESSAIKFIDELCVFKRITKGGLVQVVLESDTRKTYSVGRRNIHHIDAQELIKYKSAIDG